MTAAAVEAASKRLGFDLAYHSDTEIGAARSVLDELLDVERGLTRNLAPDERQFINNERMLCALDYSYYTARYCWIVNWRKEAEQFRPNVAQRMMADIRGDLEERGQAIHILQLKARRLGVSTDSELCVAHRVQFHQNTNAVVASADPTKSVVMADMIDFTWKNMPWWLMPRDTKVKNGMPVEFGELNSGITIQAGNQFNGVARGATPNVYHVSEIAEWVDAEDLIDASLLRAIVDFPGVFGIIEGTGEGKHTYFHDRWEKAKKEWPSGRGRQMPVFLPWFVGTDIYPSPTWLRAHPVPTEWSPSDKTIQHADKARAYVLTNPLLFKHLARGNRDWRLTSAQMWYREVEYESAKESKALNKYLSEMAGDDNEAFQAQNLPIIDPEIILSYNERTRQPKHVYTIIGPDIPPTLVTPKRLWDPNKPTITVDTREVLPQFGAKYQLIPLKFHGYDSFDPQMKLLIWEEPSDQYTYGLGADCAEGVGQDNACMQVLREAKPDREPGQVAEWVCNTVTAFQMWPLTLALGCLYSTYSFAAQRRVQLRMAIESWTNGSALQNELQKRGWSNFHPWKYNDTRRPKSDGDVQRIGVFTNQWFRSQMMDMLLTCLSEEAIDLPSPYLVDELETLERIAGQKKIAAQYGMHDDRIMAIGFPLFSLHQNKPPSKQFARKRVDYVPGLTEDLVSYPVWTSPAHATSRPFQPAQAVTRSRHGRPAGLDRLYNHSMPKGYR
jgi:hypothetical protein